MSGVDFIENLKIRASYGALGNQMIGDLYPYISGMPVGTSNYIMDSGRIPEVEAAGLISPSLTWETVVSKDIGLDFALFESKLSGSFDYYIRETKDMLMSKEYPPVLGAEAPKINAANLKTQGWEMSLTWQDRTNLDLNYSVTVGLSNYKGTITKYSNPSGALSEYYVGMELGEIWGFKTVGIFQSEEAIENAADQSRLGSNWMPGDIHYADLNNDGKVSRGAGTLENHGDLIRIGNNTPHYIFSIDINLNYHNWHLRTFFQGVGDREMYPATGDWTWFFPFKTRYIDKGWIDDLWSKNNRDAYFYGPYIAFNSNKNVHPQTRYLQNAAYIRLKNITLSYNFSRELISKIGIDQLRIYLSGRNIWTYSPIRDPLYPGSSNVANHSNPYIEYPMRRVFSIGASVSF